MSLTCCFGTSNRESASVGPPPAPPVAPSRSTLRWFRKLYGYSRQRTFYSDSTGSSRFSGRRRRRNDSATTDDVTLRTSDAFTRSDPTIIGRRRGSSHGTWYRRFTRKRRWSSGLPREPPAAPPKRRKGVEDRVARDGDRRRPSNMPGAKYFKIKRFWERLASVSSGHGSRSGMRRSASPVRTKRKVRDNRGMSVPTLESTEF